MSETQIKDFVRQLNYPTRKIDGNFLLKTKITEVVSYLTEADKVFKESSKLRQEVIYTNRKIEEDFIAYLLDELKIDQWKIFKKKKRGRGWAATTIRGDMYVHWKKACEDLKIWVPMRTPKVADFGTCSNCQYELVYSNVTLIVRFNQPHTIQEIFDKSVAEIKRYEQSVAKENKHLVVAKEFLDKQNGDYSELISAKDIIKIAEEWAKEEYRESVEGDEIDVTHGDGDDCTWEIGERRCICGNNRYYLEVGGNLLDGYYSYGQWH